MARFKGENPYIYGLHDRGGEHLLVENGTAKGWVLVTEAIGANPGDGGGGNYDDLAQKGLGVIVRLNNAYGKNGTIPRSAEYDNFAKRAANFVASSRGASIWIIGNEMNFEREQPTGERITPRLYAECYKKCRAAIKGVSGHGDDLVITGAIGPWNGETPYEADPQGAYGASKIPGAPGAYPYQGFFGDYISYMRDFLLAIGPQNCDGIGIHAYSHGYNANLVFSDEKMGPPFQKYNYHFRTYRDQMNAIPQNMRHLPVYITEANGDKEPNGATWPFGNNGWIKNAYKEINDWNQASNQQIRCVILFRWIIDPLGWSIDGKPEVQKDLKEAMARNYQWQVDVKPTPIPVVHPTASGATPPATPPVKAPVVQAANGLTIEDISASLPSNPAVAPYQRRNTSAIRRFILHHTATAANVPVERIANFQVQTRNQPGIVYHYCIDADGKVFQTQPLEVVSTHAGQFSSDSVGVCLMGDFTASPPGQKQLSATAALIAYLAGQLNITPGDQTIVGYSDLTTTASPGATWPTWKQPLINAVRSQMGQVTPTRPTPEPTPPKPQTPGYRADYVNHNTPRSLRANQTLFVNLVIRNAGSFTWVRDGVNAFHLGFRWFDSRGQMVNLPTALDFRASLPNNVLPNQSVTVQARLQTPDTPGQYRLQWDMVQEQVTWFSQQGDPGLVIDGITLEAVPAPTPTPTSGQPTPTQISIRDVSAQLPVNSAASPYQRRSLNLIRRFVIHHTATAANVSVERIADFQVKSRNLPGISYHYCLTDQGQVYQTQPLEVIALHAQSQSRDSIGVCLIGDFTTTPPPAAQLTATAALLVQIGSQLGLAITANTVVGYSELVTTASPGATWPAWKPDLLRQAQALQTGQPVSIPTTPTTPTTTPAPTTPTTPTTPTPTQPTKTIDHYLLLWHRSPTEWAEWDMLSAIDYVAQFRPTLGFSIDEAKAAKYVTIVGGPGGVPASAEQTLRAAGCQVERLNGRTQEETNQMLYDLVAAKKRFRTLS